MADQTPVIVGLAVGLSVGLVLIVALAICVYYQHKKMKKKPTDGGYVIDSGSVNVVTSAPKEVAQAVPVQQAPVDLNPETGQPLPMAFVAATQERAFAAQEPPSVVSPIFLQPSLAFNSNAGVENPFMNRLYPNPDGVPYGNDALLPEQGPMPSRFGRFGFHKSTSWLGPVCPQQPQQQFQLQQQQQQQYNANDYNPMNRPPVAEEPVQRNKVMPLGSSERFAFSDGEEIERKKKKKRKSKNEDIEFVVREATNKYKHKRSNRHGDSSSSSSSSGSSSSESGSSDSESSTESTSRLRVIQPGTDSFYLVEDGNNKKKNKKKKRHKKIIAMIPQPVPKPMPQPAPVQPAPPPPPPPQPPQPNPPPPQPMIFILPGGCQQQQVQQPRVPEYEVKPVSVPAPKIPQGSAFFKAGGGTGSAEYETQERSAQIGEDQVDFGSRKMNIQIRVSSGVERSFAGYSGGGCTSCEAGGGSYGGGVYEISAGASGGYGGTAAAYGSSQGGAVRQTSGTTQDGYEEAGYSMSF